MWCPRHPPNPTSIQSLPLPPSSKALAVAGDRQHSSNLASAAEMDAGFIVGIIGGLLLAHAAYSTIQYRGMLKIVEEEFSGPPFNVVAELLVALALCIWAGLAVPGKFLSVLSDSDENRVVSVPVNMDFMIFNHRGKVLLGNSGLKLKA